MKNPRLPEAVKSPAQPDEDTRSSAGPELVVTGVLPPRIFLTRRFRQTGAKLRQFGGGDTTRFSR